MRVGRLSIHSRSGSMGRFAAWAYETGYWRWALYWMPTPRGFAVARERGAMGNVYPHFGMSVFTPFGTLRLATQPAMPGMKKAATQ